MPLDLDMFNRRKAEDTALPEHEPSRPGTPPPPITNEGKLATESSAWQRRVEQVKGRRLQPRYDAPKPIYGVPWTPPTRRGETAEQMPNYPQLTKNEQMIYEWLPGFAETTVGQTLAKFGEGPWGKALSVLDVGAEAFERSLGLGSQFWNARNNPAEIAELRNNMSAAWYAGSLAADMTNLPTYSYDDTGNITAFRLPAALPGADGIAAARKNIIDLIF